MTTQLDQSVDQILARYLTICNRSLQENTDIFWYRQAKRINSALWGNANFHTVVYGDDPDDVLGEHTIHFDAERMRLNLLPEGDGEVAFEWKVPLAYLQDVVDRPEWYLSNPLQLDLMWFGERIRTEARSKGPLLVTVTLLATGALVAAAVLLWILRDDN
jgi:hypothetical protein